MTASSRRGLALATLFLFVFGQGCVPLPDTANDPPLTLITEIAPTPTTVPPTATRPATATLVPPGIQGDAVEGGSARDQSFSEDLITGPAPYPSPSAEITAWEQLIDPNPIAVYQWETYSGELRGSDKSSRWTFAFSYPAGWYADTKPSFVQAFVQNIPVTQGPAPSEFVKFEIVRLTDPPMIEEGHALDPKDVITIEIAGERGILYSVTQQTDQRRQITVMLQHEGGWLVAAGYIALSTADAAALDRHTAAVFHMLSSLTFAGSMDKDSARVVIITLVALLLILSACSPQVQAQFPGAEAASGIQSAKAAAPASPTSQPRSGAASRSLKLPIILQHPFQTVAFQEGPFDFELRLYQDPGFSQNPSMTWMYSDLPGVGTHVSWVYHGPALEGPVVESWGTCPDISPRGAISALKDGESSIREGGVLLPKDIIPGSVVQFVYKIETSQGPYGGLLSFLLPQEHQRGEMVNSSGRK